MDGRRELEFCRVIRADRRDIQIGVVFRQCRCAMEQKIPRYIDRRILRQIRQSIQKGSYFDAGTAAKFDEVCPTPDKFGNFSQPLFQDADFGPRGIIFLKIANLVENLGAALIVEEFARQFFLRLGEAIEHGGSEIFRCRIEIDKRNKRTCIDFSLLRTRDCHEISAPTGKTF